MPGSGKEEFVQVARELGYEIVRMGDTVREEARRRGLPISDAAVGGMAHEERRIHGPGIWAERTLTKVRGDRVLIDGLRSLAELEVFRKAFGKDLRVVAIRARRPTRYERVLRRGRPDDVMSPEAFANRDERELGWGLGEVIEAADLTIDNEGTLDEFRARVRKVLEGLDG